MNRRQLETLLVTLESTPALLMRAASEISVADIRRRPAGGGFSFLESVWHLADLEREGYGARIRSLLTEDRPVLPNFDGDSLARERRYQDRDLAEGLAAFAAARRENLETLRGATAAQWKRPGVQEKLGAISLADQPRMMAEHDRSHTNDIAALLSELRGEVEPGRRHLTSAVA